jgi:mono/diheme cytochrome c family protein
MRTLTAILAFALPLLCSPAFAPRGSSAASGSPTPRAVPGDTKPDAKHSDDWARPFLTRHCQECHRGEKPKGDFLVDRLGSDFADDAVRGRWLTVLKRIRAGEMPPKSKPRPPEKEVQALTAWIRTRAEAAETARRSTQGRVVLRRLNRVEYENTVRDLLGVQVELKESLPLDTPAHGFDNIGEALHVSSFLMERYLEAAEKALNVAIANGPRPPLIKKRYSLNETHQVKVASERVFRKLGDTVVCFSSSPWQAVTLSPFWPPDRGKYRFRISASGFQSSGKPVTYRVDAGTMGMAGRTHLVGYFDAPADRPAVVEFVKDLEPRSTIRLLPYGLANATAVHKIGADDYKGPGLAVQWVEVEGPLHDSWPPESHRRIFGGLPQQAAPVFNNRNRVEVVSKDPEADAERILRGFARRAFRRAVTDEDIRPFLNLVKGRLAKKYTFEQAVRVGLMGVLVSPNFLFLREKAGKLDDFALASRLSYFLWSTTPDEELLTLAGQKKLSRPDVLRAQVERLLNDRKAAAFTENFVGQWLGLREIDATIPSHILYPEYDDMLKHSMLRETYLFFDEVLKHDLSLTNFAHSDFTMLNGRLARHYGIPGVDGWEFKKVALPRESHRGGVLTMASVLKVTANGTYTSPILRGAWVLERILGTPPPRPPEGVTAVEPDIRGATTIRQQLEKHRKVASCASCHARIDPPGFALESFDVIGGWRDYYRTSGNGKAVMVDGRRMPYLQGPKVDPADVLPDGSRFRDIDEFKQLLLKDKDQLARALTEKLVTYATGAAPQTADRPEIEAIVRSVRARNYGLRTLVHEIVKSRLFLHK